MKKSNPFIAAALTGLLSQSLPAIWQEDQNIAGPFRTDITQILNGTQWQVVHVDSIWDLSKVAEMWSSVVAEGVTGLTDRALSELQEYINTNYSHLNILVYIADDGWYSSNENEVCDSNDRLKVMKSEYYNNAISWGEWSHVILYLAWDNMNHPRRLTCALISPQMAELTWPDDEIFRQGQALYDAVAAKWRPDFDRIGAVHVFLEELDKLIRKAEIDIQRQQLIYTQSIESIRTQLNEAEQMLVWSAEVKDIILDSSRLFQDFQRISDEARVIISWEIQHVDESDKSEAEGLLRNASSLSSQIFSALENLDTYTVRFTQYNNFTSEFLDHPYKNQLESQFSAFQVSLGIVLAKIESGNIDYILDVDELEELYVNLIEAISYIDTTRIQLQDLETRILATSESTDIDVIESSLFQWFRGIWVEIWELLMGGWIHSRDEIRTLLNDADDAHNQILSALSGMGEYEKRVDELQGYAESFENHNYRDDLSAEFVVFQVSLAGVAMMIHGKNIDYISYIEQVEDDYLDLTDWILKIDKKKITIKISIWIAILSVATILGILNRRPSRLKSKEDFETKLGELRNALELIKKVFEDEIKGEADSIKIFFWEQEGDTAERIDSLKQSVAYISVLIPKIDEILKEVGDSTWASLFSGKPFDRGMKMLSESNYKINPLESTIDKDLLNMINGWEEIQDMSTLVDVMNQTLPELISRLDNNIQVTKSIFKDINDASTNLDTQTSLNKQLESELIQEIELLKSMLHPSFYSYIDEKISEIPENFSTVRSSINGVSKDILKQFRFTGSFNEYIKHFITDLQSLREYIDTNNPLKNREWLALAGYDMKKHFTEMWNLFLEFITKGLSFSTENPSPTQWISDVLTSITNAYEITNLMNEAENMRSTIIQKWNWIIALKGRSESSIRATLWELLTAEEIFIEEEFNTQEMYTIAEQELQKAKTQIQNKDFTEVRVSIEKAVEILDEINKIIVNTRAVSDWYSNNVDGLEKNRSNIEWSIDNMQSKLQYLQGNFDASVLELRISDFQADESDGDLSNNVVEIKQYLWSAQTFIDMAKTSTNNGYLLETDKHLTEAFYLYEDANERIQELTLSYDLITQTHTKNTASFPNIVSKFWEVLELSSSAHTTWKTQEFTIKLKKDLENIKAQVWIDKPNPYDIEDLLTEFSDNTTQLEASIQRDQAEYDEYVEYSILAQEKGSGYKRLLSIVSTDSHPDSNKVDKFVANAANIENELNKIWGFSEKRVSDWYKLTDRLEDIIKRCDYNTGFIHKESKERNNVTSAINTASREIKKAKRWSWRYVSISSAVWDSSLREAHRYYEAWEFWKALETAKSAKTTAIRAVSNAEDADRREQRRRDEEKRRREEARRAAARAAAAAARRASQRAAARRSSSSSSSSSISFGWWSSGGSGFSGWRM